MVRRVALNESLTVAMMAPGVALHDSTAVDSVSEHSSDEEGDSSGGPVSGKRPAVGGAAAPSKKPATRKAATAPSKKPAATKGAQKRAADSSDEEQPEQPAAKRGKPAPPKPNGKGKRKRK